jgi:hypothetical protein
MTRGTGAPQRQKVFAATFTTWLKPQVMKSANCISTTGRKPRRAAPQAMPMVPDSAMGVLMTRAFPNSSRKPRVTLKAPPYPAMSCPRRRTRRSRRISSRSAREMASRYVEAPSSGAEAARAARRGAAERPGAAGGRGGAAKTGRGRGAGSGAARARSVTSMRRPRMRFPISSISSAASTPSSRRTLSNRCRGSFLRKRSLSSTGTASMESSPSEWPRRRTRSASRRVGPSPRRARSAAARTARHTARGSPPSTASPGMP